MADKVISLWGGLRHLRQKAVQVIFALVDIVMEHKCPIKAEVIYDKNQTTLDGCRGESTSA